MSNLERITRIKKFFTRFLITILFLLFFLWLYMIYSKIDVVEDYAQYNTTVEKAALTVAESEEQGKTVSGVIEEANRAIVGISKIKDIGASIFSQNNTALGVGTGFIVSENGYIISNEHVSGEKYSTCYVTLENGKVYNGNVVWSDSNLDLSIVKINMKNLDYMKLGDSDDTKIGENVYAIGNPVGYEFQRTVTSGIISALDRTIKFTENDQEIYMADLIQTDATINPGNSGGPLIKPDGTVIAVNSVKITSADGIGFAVPINVVKPVIEKYISTGSFEEATLGIFAYDKNVIPYLDSNLNMEAGIYVQQVVLGSSAEKSGIRQKDIIMKIDGIEVNKMNDLKKYIYSKNPGDEVILTIQRNRQMQEVKVYLGKK